MENKFTSSSSKKGFGGWLIPFSIFSAVLLPFFAIKGINEWNSLSSSIIRRYPGLGTLKTLEIFFGAGLAIFGIYLAYALITKKVPGTIKLAELFLIIYGATSVLVALIVVSSSLPGIVTRKIPSWIVVRLSVATVFFLYFRRSKRVKATYFASGSGTNYPEPPIPPQSGQVSPGDQ